MNSAQTMNRPTPEDDDLGQATVRELIVQLALAEDEQRKSVNAGRTAALHQREQAILAALSRNGLDIKGSPIQVSPLPAISPATQPPGSPTVHSHGTNHFVPG